MAGVSGQDCKFCEIMCFGSPSLYLFTRPSCNPLPSETGYSEHPTELNTLHLESAVQEKDDFCNNSH